MRVQSIVINGSSTEPKSIPLSSQLNSTLKGIVSKMFPVHEPTARHDPASDPQMNVQLPQSYSLPKQSTSYEISFKPIRGKFKVEEALRLGVPKGQLFAQLTKGLSVTLSDGTVVEPGQVLEKERNFAKVLILDIPSDAYWPQFFEKFQEYYSTSLGAVYYFMGDDVTIGEDLISLMEKLDTKNTQHFVSHSKVCPNNIVFRSSAITTLKLKAVQNKNYNLPHADRVYSKEFYECFQKPLPRGSSRVQKLEEPLTSVIEQERVHIMLQNNSVIIEPFTNGEESLKARHQESFRPMAPWSKLYEKHVSPLGIPGASYQSIVEEQKQVNNFDSALKRNKIEVITLGTGSSLPSKYRNVISTLVKVPYNNKGKIYNRSILLDAGENTLGAMLRIIPRVQQPELFKSLKLAYLPESFARRSSSWYCKYTQ